MNHYFGQYIYKILYDVSLVPNKNELTEKSKKSIFFRALYFLEAVNKKGINNDEPLLIEFNKDPLVYLFNLISRQKDESDYQYISRIQDNIPRKYNDIFVKGPVIITRYYLDMLKAMGMIHTADLNIDTDTSATYYRTKALVQLYNGNPKASISILDYLQKKYQLEDSYTYLLLVAAMIDNDDYENASLTLALAQNILKNDTNVDFLIGIGFFKDLKLLSAMKYFKHRYSGELIDFKLVGLDKLLKDL